MSMDTVKKLGLRPTDHEYPDFAMYEAVLDIVGLSQQAKVALKNRSKDGGRSEPTATT